MVQKILIVFPDIVHATSVVGRVASRASQKFVGIGKSRPIKGYTWKKHFFDSPCMHTYMHAHDLIFIPCLCFLSLFRGSIPVAIA